MKNTKNACSLDTLVLGAGLSRTAACDDYFSVSFNSVLIQSQL